MDQLNELKKQIEKERDFKCQEATKEFDNVKLEVESRRCDLEARQKNVEAVVSEVILFCYLQKLTKHFCSPIV